VIAMAFQALLLQALFMSGDVRREYGTRRAWRFEWTKARELFRIGWPAGVAEFLDVASWSVFTSFIVGGFGTVQLGAHTAAINFMHLTFIPAIGIGMAITPVVGRWLGGGDYRRAKRRAYTATKLAIVIMITIGTTLAVFGPWLMRIFSADPEVIRLGHVLLILAAVFAGFDAVNIVLYGALRGAGDTRWTMVTLAIGAYCGCLPLSWFFAHVVGLEARGAWIGAALYIMGLCGVFLWRFQSEAWRSIRIFSEDAAGHVAAVPAGPAPAAVEGGKSGVPQEP